MQLTKQDIQLLKAEFKTISNWDQWEELSTRFFDWENAPCVSLDQIEADLQRESKFQDNRLWEPFAGNYDIDPSIERLFEDLRQKVFAKLEPKAHAENQRHPERYGWQCLHCRVFTRPQTETCSFCGRDLLPLPLNE